MSKRPDYSGLRIEINQVAIHATVETAAEFAARLASFGNEQRTLVYLSILAEGLDAKSGLHSFLYFWRGRHALSICRALEHAGLTKKHRLFAQALSLFGDVFPTDDAARTAHFGWSTPSRELNDFDRQLLAISAEFGPYDDLESAIAKCMRAAPSLRPARAQPKDDRTVATYREVVGIIKARGSSTLLAAFERFDQKLIRRICKQGVRVVDVPVKHRLQTDGVPTLVIGDVDCSLVDLTVSADGDDCESLLVVLGNIRCDNFVNAYDTAVFVDGDLAAQSAIVNGFEHASLTVVGKLSTSLFVGFDIWAEVGRGADMEYGHGYCLPIGWERSGDGDASRQVIRPARSKEETTSRFGTLDAARLSSAIRSAGTS